MRTSGDDDLVAEIEGLLPHISGGAALAQKLTPEIKAKLRCAMPGLKDRAKTLIELIDHASHIWAPRPISLDEKAKALLSRHARVLIGEVAHELQGVDPWSADTTEAVVRGFAERRELKLGAVAQPLRAALTGRTTSPGIFDVLAVLGKEESLARLHDVASDVATAQTVR
jgi:glutamyl-tRNA synthetase